MLGLDCHRHIPSRYPAYLPTRSSMNCPVCSMPTCPPSGSSKDVLVISEFPGRLEMEQKKPFATSHMFTTAGKVFRKELERVGVSLNQWRVMNLWMHEPNEREDCWQAGYDKVLDEAKGKQAILLVGSDTVSTFTKYKVSEVNGLQVDSHILSAPIIYALIQPAIVLHGRGLGEVRFGIEKFVKRLEQENLL